LYENSFKQICVCERRRTLFESFFKMLLILQVLTENSTNMEIHSNGFNCLQNVKYKTKNVLNIHEMFAMIVPFIETSIFGINV